MCKNCQNKLVGKAPYRVDHVGSFLRPKELVEARAKFVAGEITQEELTKVEDKTITELVEKQITHGLKGVTDGEFRRAYWHLDFFWGLNGVEHTQAKVGYQFHDEFLRDLVGDRAEVKQTIPAPAQFYFELIRDEEHIAQTNSIYPNKEELFADIIAAYKQVIKEHYDAGCRVIQLDDCTWGAIVDDRLIKLIAEGSGFDPEGIRETFKKEFITLNNGILTDLPEDLVVNTHICRGNYHSTWASSGGYDSVADTLFGEENVNAYYLEYDTDRAGDFKPLAKVGNDKKVVLGLLTSKSGKLENKDEVIARIREASEYVPLENIYLSTQCGFASTEEGNILTEEDQWKKIALISEITQEVWGNK